MYFCVFCRFLWNPYTWVSPAAMLSWPPEMPSLYGIFVQPKVGQHSSSMTNPRKTTNHRKNSIMSMTRPLGACSQLRGAGVGRPSLKGAARVPVNFRWPMTRFVVLRHRKKFCWLRGKVDLYRDMRCQMWLWLIDIISVLKLINWLWIVIARKSFLAWKIRIFCGTQIYLKELEFSSGQVRLRRNLVCLPVLYPKVFQEHYIASKCKYFPGYLHCCLQNWLPRHNVHLRLKCLSNLWHVGNFSEKENIVKL